MKAKEKKTKSAVSTRKRILDGALRLFNENGETTVTTAQIAEFIGISEGNLWYHFRTKREIVFELFCRLEAEVDGNLSRLPEENLDLRDFMSYAALAFGYLWEYRFLYRDRSDRVKDVEIINHIRELIGRGQSNVERILEDMRRREMLFLSADEGRVLAINAWIIQSNWLSFVQMREKIQEITEAHIKEGFAQLISLFKPYLSEVGKREAAAFISEFSLAQFKKAGEKK